MSKPITAAAILLLADRGKLSISDHVSKYVPGFPNGVIIDAKGTLYGTTSAFGKYGYGVVYAISP